jgi:hypothetical protein
VVGLNMQPFYSPTKEKRKQQREQRVGELGQGGARNNGSSKNFWDQGSGGSSPKYVPVGGGAPKGCATVRFFFKASCGTGLDSEVFALVDMCALDLEDVRSCETGCDSER